MAHLRHWQSEGASRAFIPFRQSRGSFQPTPRTTVVTKASTAWTSRSPEQVDHQLGTNSPSLIEAI